MTPTCTLTVTSGPAAGSEVEVDRELIIGRRDADLTIPDPELSRHHAAVRPVETGFVVEDLGSLNGTFVDGERISGPVTLTAATVRVGCSELSLHTATVVEAPQPEEPADDSGRTRLASTLPPVPDAPSPSPSPAPASDAELPATAPEQPPAAEPPDAEPLTAPQEPVSIPQPQVTRVRPIPGAEPQPPRASPQEPVSIPQPQVTRVRPVVPAGDRAQAGGVPRADAAGSPGGEAQAKPPGMFKRLLGRILGRRPAKRAGG